VGADSVAPVVPKVPVAIPNQREGGLSRGFGTFGASFLTVNSEPVLATEGATVSKKSKRRQERGDEELVSRVRELVVADVRAEVRARLDIYVKELWTAVQEVKVRNKVNDRLVVKGSHKVSERSKRHGKGRQKLQNEGEWIIQDTFYSILIVV
jgi:hypothetical protein